MQPYLPKEYSIESTDELLHILRTSDKHGILASLDAESLFTNVPIERTIDIILRCVYESPLIPPPKISKEILQTILQICTQEAPFRHIDGSLYRQTDGIAMGSPLGPIFANFYMSDLEARVLKGIDLQNKPLLYLRYVDDIIIIVQEEQHLYDLKENFEKESVLRFTTELGWSSLHFLDVNIEFQDNSISTSVYTKRTNEGDCLNFKSECPEKYKRSVIFTLLNRAYKISSNWIQFNSECVRLKQIFVNNNYPVHIIEEETKIFLNKKLKSATKTVEDVTHTLYYKNQMTPNYQTDERIIKGIFTDKVKCIKENERLSLRIYYNNMKVKNMLMKNNMTKNNDKLRMSNVVYKINCPVKDCKLSNPYYIGCTQCTVAKRITGHLQHGSIRSHIINNHNLSIERNHLIDNVCILKTLKDKERLLTYEALSIKALRPSINTQDDDLNRYTRLYSTYPDTEQILERHIPRMTSNVSDEQTMSRRQHGYSTRLSER